MIDRVAKTWVEISKSALINNVRSLRSALSAETELMAVLKSNAYGHGLIETASVIVNEVDWFGVDSLSEAISLRSVIGDQKNILILGYIPPEYFDILVNNNFSSVVYDIETINELSVRAGNNNIAKVHIKIETGTTRQGVEGENLQLLLEAIKNKSNVKLTGVYTHFANIEDTSDTTYAKNQLARFEVALEQIKQTGLSPKYVHSACSAAGILFPETHYDLVRFGISLYGLWSSKLTQLTAENSSNPVKLTPALTWKTKVAQIKLVKAGTPISYGLTEKVNRDSVVAVLPVGYWDGFDRRFSSVGQVLINGQRAKVLGRVCMNMTMVDITDIDEVKKNDEVVLLGKQQQNTISAENLAEMIGTINYEIITRINPTLPRYLVD